MTSDEIVKFIYDNCVEISMNDTWWSKDGSRFKPKYHIVINGCSMADMQLREAIEYYKGVVNECSKNTKQNTEQTRNP